VKYRLNTEAEQEGQNEKSKRKLESDIFQKRIAAKQQHFTMGF